MPYANPPSCRFVGILKDLAVESERVGARGLAYVAKGMLDIVTDVTREFLTDDDINTLADLVDEFRREGHGELFSYLREDYPDCHVCAALAKRLSLVKV